jgi:hypothetical protein
VGWQVRLVCIAAKKQSHLRAGNSSSAGGYPSGQRGLTVNQLAERLRRFESFTAHWSQDQNCRERQALIAQPVEHVLGKNGVMGSSPIEGSYHRRNLNFFALIKGEKEWRSRNMNERSRI